jgi:hypothetical protein
MRKERARTKLELREHAVAVCGVLDPRRLVGGPVEREAFGGAVGELGIVHGLLTFILIPAPETDFRRNRGRSREKEGW